MEEIDMQDEIMSSGVRKKLFDENHMDKLTCLKEEQKHQFEIPSAR